MSRERKRRGKRFLMECKDIKKKPKGKIYLWVWYGGGTHQGQDGNFTRQEEPTRGREGRRERWERRPEGWRKREEISGL
jgi:hypothetical protein